MDCLLSVIIPVYNGEKYLENTINSVLNQPFENINIIIVNDGSTDNSKKIINEIKEKCNRIIVLNQINRGVSSARNTGLCFALNSYPETNHYICFLDSDDMWCQNSVCSQFVSNFENNDIIATSCFCSNQGMTRYSIFHQYTENQIFLNYGSTQWILSGHLGSCFFNLSFLKKNNLLFNERINANEDIIFMRQAVFCSEKIKMFKQYVYIYRTNQFGVTHNQSLTVENAFKVADYWNLAKNWKNKDDKFQSQKNRWEKLCDLTVESNKLETFRNLAVEGYSYKTIKNIAILHGDSDILSCIVHLDTNMLAKWQRKDLVLIRKHFRIFCYKYNCVGILIRLLKKIFSQSWTKKAIDIIKFPIRSINFYEILEEVNNHDC